MNETINDIVREMREKKGFPVPFVGWRAVWLDDLTMYADRIEVVVKTLEADRDYWRRQALSKDVRENAIAEKSSTVGDNAKMREALKEAQKRLEQMVGCDMHRYHREVQTCDGQTTTGDCAKMATCKVIFQIRSALSEPPRNKEGGAE